MINERFFSEGTPSEYQQQGNAKEGMFHHRMVLVSFASPTIVTVAVMFP